MSVCVIADPGSTWRIPGEPWGKSWQRMRDLIDLAADAGAQTIKPQLLRRGMYRDGTAAAELVSQYEVPAEWLPRLKEACDERGLELMVTAYRAVDVALVNPYVKRFKVAGFDATNAALLRAVRRTKKPVIISASLGHQPWEGGPEWWRQATYLHCVSQYPAPPENMNLRVLHDWNYELDGGDTFNGPDCKGEWLTGTSATGLSDHTIGSTAAVIAVAYGASVIEKHIRHALTPEANPDYAAAASPEDFKAYVAAIREAEVMLGDGVKRVMEGEWTQYKYDPATGRRAGD